MRITKFQRPREPGKETLQDSHSVSVLITHLVYLPLNARLDPEGIFVWGP